MFIQIGDIIGSNLTPSLQVLFDKVSRLDGHKKSNKGDSECSKSGEWYIKDESEWLQCPICEQWFHETFFNV